MSATRSLLRAMTITGSTQAVSIMLSIARMKVLAILLGPSGVGVLSIFTNFQTTASTFAGVGLASSGVRQIAQGKSDSAEHANVRRVVLVAHLFQGLVAMAAIWILREPIARWIFGKTDYAFEVGIVGIAVFLTLLSASQTTLLRGMRRVGDLGRVTVFGALAGTVGGIAAIWYLGMAGLLWFVLLQPLTAVVVAAIFTRRLPRAVSTATSWHGLWRTWKPMAQLGVAFMLGGLATSATLLFVRAHIAGDLGLDAAGQFAAAWGVTMTYVGFLLSAMGMDYYPRLAEIIHDQPAAARLMNDQAQIGVAIGGPVLLLLIGLAPAAIAVLYSSEFDQAVTLLQWQTAGNIFKLAAWPIGFAFAAAAQPRLFLLTQLTFNGVFLAMIWLGLPKYGLAVAGHAFLAAYVVCFSQVYLLARSKFNFRWDRLSLALIYTHAGLACALLALSLRHPFLGAGASAFLFVVTAFVGGHILLEKIGVHPRVAPFARIYAICGWPVGRQK